VTFFVVRVGNFWRFNSGFFKKRKNLKNYVIFLDFFGFFVFALWFLML